MFPFAMQRVSALELYLAGLKRSSHFSETSQETD